MRWQERTGGAERNESASFAPNRTKLDLCHHAHDRLLEDHRPKAAARTMPLPPRLRQTVKALRAVHSTPFDRQNNRSAYLIVTGDAERTEASDAQGHARCSCWRCRSQLER